MLVSGFMNANHVKHYSSRWLVIVVFIAHMAQLNVRQFSTEAIVVKVIKWSLL
jgi:hypothetical protein